MLINYINKAANVGQSPNMPNMFSMAKYRTKMLLNQAESVIID